jgi:DNA-binding CsgD family transcriptional regulator
VLTPRERSVLELVAGGHSTRAIGRRLYVSPQAVTYHIGNLHAKFECGNRAGLVARAFVLGFLTTSDWPPRVVEEGSIPARTNTQARSHESERLSLVST